MKKTLIIVLALCLVIAATATASIVSSKHDMRNNVTVSGRTVKAANSTTSQVCVFCHHPHRGTATNVTSVLLWNISDANKDYATYASPTTNAAAMGGNVTSSYTLLCMGCHDGATSSNTFIRKSADGTLGSMPAVTGAANLGATLADDHPVDFTYPTAAAAGLEDIQLAAAGKVKGKYPLFGGTMQCATCHSVHDPATANGGVQFMRGTVTNSVICIDCHTAK